MNCPKHSLRLIEYLEAAPALSAADRAAMADHLAGCPACQAEARRWQALDAALNRALKPPALPGDFTARLQQRIAAESRQMTAEEVARKKRALLEEYEAGLRRLRFDRGDYRSLDQATWLVLAASVILPALAWLGASGQLGQPAPLKLLESGAAWFAAAGLGIAAAALAPMLRPAWQRWF
jgi:anti-sigma factor RsiW